MPGGWQTDVKSKLEKADGKNKNSVAIAETNRRINALLDDVTSADQPGLTMAVWFDGNIVTSQARGLARLQPRCDMSPETLLPVDSIAKQFTACAIAMAVGASGAVGIRTSKLLTTDQVDAAANKTVDYRPPGA